jgi:hypothetical protein
MLFGRKGRKIDCVLSGVVALSMISLMKGEKKALNAECRFVKQHISTALGYHVRANTT